MFDNKRELFRSRKLDKKKYEMFKWTRGFLILLVIIFIVFRLLIGFSKVDGNSMNPTLKNGEFILYSRVYNDYNRGDIVSLRIPNGDYYVKRIVGLPGDEIMISNGTLYINGEPEQQDYSYGSTEEEKNKISYPYVVKEGYVFVIGDNRESSTDSRSFGAVGQQQILGKVEFVGGFFYAHRI